MVINIAKDRERVRKPPKRVGRRGPWKWNHKVILKYLRNGFSGRATAALLDIPYGGIVSARYGKAAK